MIRDEIKKLSEKKICSNNIENTYEYLSDYYDVSFDRYNPSDLKKAIHNSSPFYIKDNFVVGYEDGKFFNDNGDSLKIERMVKAVIVNDVSSNIPSTEISSVKIEAQQDQSDDVNADFFAIVDKNEWGDVSDFFNIIGTLKIGKPYLPEHSVIFNFRDQTEEEKKNKIVSYLQGNNIYILNKDNYIDNCFHEIGHVFWRDCLEFEEQKRFKQYMKVLKPSALYEYEWERSNAEEVFCTIYKWFLKAKLLNKSFMNILEFEEPKGLEMLLSVLRRIKEDRMIEDIWSLHKNNVFSFINPRRDSKGRIVMQKGLSDMIKGIKVPKKEIHKSINKFEDGYRFIDLEKSTLCINDNDEIVFEQDMRKTISDKTKTIYFDMDRVIADFDKGFYEQFGIDPTKIDSFTTRQYYTQNPHFFRNLPVIPQGLELFNSLKDTYNIVFLTTPDDGMPNCRMDKIDWIRENVGEHTVLFSHNKGEYATDNQSILIDDDYHNKNKDSWTNAGGTFIRFPQKNEKILVQVENIMNPVKESKRVKQTIKEMNINTNPSEGQKESGIYKKGNINYKGLNIKIENPKGSVRWGIGEDGIKWINKMTASYGYITGTEGHDNDPVDVFIGDKIGASRCFVVNQTKNGLFDEHKIILCVDNIDDAEKLYLSNYKNGWNNYTDIVQTNTKKLREWLNTGDVHMPYKND